MIFEFFNFSVSGVEPFEGDLLPDKEDKEMIKATKGKRGYVNKKNVVRFMRKRWLLGVVPYVIDPSRGKVLGYRFELISALR